MNYVRITAQGRSHLCKMADIEEADEWSAHFHATHHVAQKPQSRMPSNWEGTCMTQEELATVLPDKFVRDQSISAALLCLEEALNLHFSEEELAFEQRKWCGVSLRASTNDHVNRRKPRQDMLADNLPESSLQPVPLHNGATMLRNNEAYAGMMEKGSNKPEIQMFGPNTLPFT